MACIYCNRNHVNPPRWLGPQWIHKQRYLDCLTFLCDDRGHLFPHVKQYICKKTNHWGYPVIRVWDEDFQCCPDHRKKQKCQPEIPWGLDDMPRYFKCRGPLADCREIKCSTLDDEQVTASVEQDFQNLRSRAPPVVWIVGYPHAGLKPLRKCFGKKIAKQFGFVHLDLETMMTALAVKYLNHCPCPNQYGSGTKGAKNQMTKFQGKLPTDLNNCPANVRRLVTLVKNVLCYKSRAEAFNTCGILESLKMAFLCFPSAEGFFLDEFPVNTTEARCYESVFWPVAAGIYFMSGKWVNSKNPACNPRLHFPKIFARSDPYIENFVNETVDELGHKMVKVPYAECLSKCDLYYVQVVVDDLIRQYKGLPPRVHKKILHPKQQSNNDQKHEVEEDEETTVTSRQNSPRKKKSNLESPNENSETEKTDMEETPVTPWRTMPIQEQSKHEPRTPSAVGKPDSPSHPMPDFNSVDDTITNTTNPNHTLQDSDFSVPPTPVPPFPRGIFGSFSSVVLDALEHEQLQNQPKTTTRPNVQTGISVPRSGSKSLEEVTSDSEAPERPLPTKSVHAQNVTRKPGSQKPVIVNLMTFKNLEYPVDSHSSPFGFKTKKRTKKKVRLASFQLNQSEDLNRNQSASVTDTETSLMSYPSESDREHETSMNESSNITRSSGSSDAAIAQPLSLSASDHSSMSFPHRADSAETAGRELSSGLMTNKDMRPSSPTSPTRPLTMMAEMFKQKQTPASALQTPPAPTPMQISDTEPDEFLYSW